MGQQLEKILVLVLEGPLEWQGRDLGGAPAWPGTAVLSKALCKLRWIGRTLGKGDLTAARPWASAMLGLQCRSAGLCTPGSLYISLRWEIRQKFRSALLLTAASYRSLRRVQPLSWISRIRTVTFLFQWQTVAGFHVTCTVKDTNNSKYVSGKTETMLCLHLSPPVQWALAAHCTGIPPPLKQNLSKTFFPSHLCVFIVILYK